MQHRWICYSAITLGAVILTMTGFAVALHLTADGDQESGTAGVLGAAMEPGRDSLTLFASATPSPPPFLPTASPTPEPPAPPAAAQTAPSLSPAATPAAASPPPVPTQAPAPVPAADPPPDPAPPPPPPADWPDHEFAARVLALVNGERASRHLAPFQVHPSLATAAQAYARLLLITDTFGHEGPDGSTVDSRIYGAGFPGPAPLAESLWWGVGSLPPEHVVSAWLDSESHRQQLFSPVYSLAGIGCHFRLAERLHARCVLDLAGG